MHRKQPEFRQKPEHFHPYYTAISSSSNDLNIPEQMVNDRNCSQVCLEMKRFSAGFNWLSTK